MGQRELQGQTRVHGPQHIGTLDDPDRAGPADGDEPDQRDGAEQLADRAGAVALQRVQAEQDHQGQRHDVGFERRCRQLQALDRGQHRDGGRDDAVAVEHGRAGDAHQQQGGAQPGPLAQCLAGQRQQGHRAAFAVVVGPHDQHHILQRDDDGQCPEHQGQDAEDVRFVQRHIAGTEHFLEGVQRAGADVAIDHPESAQGQSSQGRRAAVRVRRTHVVQAAFWGGRKPKGGILRPLAAFCALQQRYAGRA